MWAILPLKRFSLVKQRLAGVLSVDERRDLFTAMVHDVLSVLQLHPEIRNTLIVSDDEYAAALANEYCAEVMGEPSGASAGLNAAVQAGVAELHRRGVTEALVIHGDLPMIDIDEISRLIRVHRAQDIEGGEHASDGKTGFGVTLAPDVQGAGTNCLVCHPASGLEFHYGVNSFAAHVREAKQRNASLQVVIAPGLSRDIDRPQDLLALAECGNETIAPHTRNYLRASGLLQRVAALRLEPRLPLIRVG
jgi:2-phospho-L-lactate/phosphoenolpyruvate guanylyltransferase